MAAIARTNKAKRVREAREAREAAEAASAAEKAKELIDFDWDPSKLKPLPPKKIEDLAGLFFCSLPISVYDVRGKEEIWQERVLRMLRTVRKTVISCSMCHLGRKMCIDNEYSFDPHVFSNMIPSRWMVVGQNPGFNECMKGEPFVGDAGKFFDKCVKDGGLSRSNFYISNAVRCHTVGNEKPMAEHVERCEPFLRIEINLLRPRLVITLGAVAFEVFCPGMKLTKNLGGIVESDKFGVKVYPVYHPSPRNMNVKARMEKFEEDISNLCKLVRTVG